MDGTIKRISSPCNYKPETLNPPAVQYLNDPLIFTTNWNHKLWCDVFSTFRHNSQKYNVGNLKSIIHRRSDGDHYITDAEIIYNEPCRLDDVNELFARLDTGYGLEDFKKIIHTMYKNKNIEWNKPVWCKLLLKCLDPDMLNEKRKQAGIIINEKSIVVPQAVINQAPKTLSETGSLF